jgi:hypothetical protein
MPISGLSLSKHHVSAGSRHDVSRNESRTVGTVPDIAILRKGPGHALVA